MRLSLSVNNQSIETSGITKDYKEAISEYIWNGFEANADEVRVDFILNDLTGLEEITIADNGQGIDHNNIQETFGAFLASKKNTLSLQAKSKANKGKGRFSFIAFANKAIWETVYFDQIENRNKEFTISLSNDSKEFVDYTDTKNSRKEVGTIVRLSELFGIDINSFLPTTINDFFLQEFAWYLYLNSNKKLIINNAELDYSSYINLDFSQKTQFEISNYIFMVDLIVWNSKIGEKFCCYYMTNDSILRFKETTTYNRNTVDFNHSVFVKSSFFDNWSEFIESIDDSQEILDYNTERKTILKELNKKIQSLISDSIDSYMSKKADEEVDKMINERKTFPTFSDDVYSQYRKKDLSHVIKVLYETEPRIFYKLKDVQEKSLLAFLNLLLITDEREQILDIIEEIVKLSPEQRKQFKDILQKTTLENIIETISFIEDRFKVIEVLKTIIYDMTTFANERDHIQKIIEQNYWLFGEKYNLASADKTMRTALENYSSILYGAKKPEEELKEDEENERRMDIFLCASRQTENAFETTILENIIVELKAPKIVLTKAVLRQIEDYMDYIRRQPAFNGETRRWKFFAICKEVDDDVKARYDTFRDRGKIGLISVTGNYEIYALTWDDVFNSFYISHDFCLNKLKLNRDNIISEMGNSIPSPSRETVDIMTQEIVNN